VYGVCAIAQNTMPAEQNAFIHTVIVTAEVMRCVKDEKNIVGPA
jgi:hypothetical protein